MSLLVAFLLAVPAWSQKLEVVAPALHQFDGGPPMPGKPEFNGGETLFFTCAFAGYKPNPKSAILLEYTIEAYDQANVLLTKPEAKKIDAELSPEDKEWKPKIHYQFEIPNTVLCEQCKLKLSVNDKISGASATSEIPFAVHSKPVESSETLTVRNFRFLRSEEDADPLAAPAYRAGDELWARFEIIGYRYGTGNRVNVEYGLSVYRPSGKLLYQELKAAAIDESSFYPKRFVNGILNIRLQGLPAGEYPIVVEVRDLSGSQKFEGRFPFKVE